MNQVSSIGRDNSARTRLLLPVSSSTVVHRHHGSDQIRSNQRAHLVGRGCGQTAQRANTRGVAEAWQTGHRKHVNQTNGVAACSPPSLPDEKKGSALRVVGRQTSNVPAKPVSLKTLHAECFIVTLKTRGKRKL